MALALLLGLLFRAEIFLRFVQEALFEHRSCLEKDQKGGLAEALQDILTLKTYLYF
jgi:hypothetical protein